MEHVTSIKNKLSQLFEFHSVVPMVSFHWYTNETKLVTIKASIGSDKYNPKLPIIETIGNNR